MIDMSEDKKMLLKDVIKMESLKKDKGSKKEYCRFLRNL